ncbi:hypothetical protein GGI12_001838 [Dipsacomyces acuminosporus]|nr:hypothetical protein GGI12_001838 [Dipsacomyces acuminosporus]
MKRLALFQLLSLALWTVKPSHAIPDGLSKRRVDTSKVADGRAALLLIDEIQTTCEIALIDNRGGYVAASCIGLKGDKGDKVDYSLKYEVYIYNGPKTTPTRYNIDAITLHPSFNQTTFANNIAVVQFNKEEKALWKNLIGKYPYEWDDRYYVRRTLDSSNYSKWNAPVVRAKLGDSEGCSDASELYKNNPSGLYCIDAAILSSFEKSCQRPYSSMYGVIQPNNLSIAALHGYSAAYGKDMCGDVKQFHYYTILANYNEWAASVLGYDVSTLTLTSNTETQPKTFAMNSTSSPNDSRVSLFSGNLYTRQAAIPPSSANSKADTALTDVSGTSNPAVSPSTASYSPATDHSNSSLTRSAIIGIAVAVPVGTILGVVGLFFLYKWWRKRKNTLTWSPNQERSNYNAIQIANELGGASDRDAELPPYESAKESEDNLDAKAG